MTESFAASVQLRENVAIVVLRGEINSAAEAALNTAYAQAEAGNPQSILLDFQAVDYINSTGIALIVGLLAQARKSHLRLVVCGLSEHYQEIFRITRLADFMQMYTDVTSALAG